MTPKRAIIWAAVSTRPQAEEDEKFSIPVQISEAEAVCAERGWQIIDRLIVPGHSRNYRDLNTLARDARAEGIDAFDRLIAHFERRDFDVIVCRDANRFARKSSLLHMIVETVIEDCRASIYSLQDRYLIDENNADMWATMKGYASRAEVKWLVKASTEGLKKRVERGLTGQKTPFSHRIIRDENYKALKAVVDESKRGLFNDIFQLIVVERAPFNGIERTLYERYGHVNDQGKPYGDKIVYSFLFHPLTWGSTVYRHTCRPDGRPGRYRDFGLWVFDSTYPVPPGVIIHRDIIEPVYSGDQGERMKAELTRRKMMRGNRRPNTTHMFSGLLVCGTCGRTLTIWNKYNLRCSAAISQSLAYAPRCTQTQTKIAYVKQYFEQLLRLLVSNKDIDYIFGPDIDHSGHEVILNQVASLEAELRNMIALQAQAAPAAQPFYQQRIDSVAEQVEKLRDREYNLRMKANTLQLRRHSAKEALGTIGEIIEQFWTLPEAEINQHLHRLLGNRRLVIFDSQVAGWIERDSRPYIRRRE